jgi:heavy metal sensor kinase
MKANLMKWFRTLRVRFAFWVAALILIVLLIFGSFVYFNLKAGLSTEIDNSLRLSATQAIAAVNIENGQINFSDSVPQADSIADLRASGITVRILSLKGDVVQGFGPYQSLPVDSSNLGQTLQGASEFSTVLPPTDTNEVRLYTTPIMDNDHPVGGVQVIQSLASVTQALNNLMTGFFISVPLLVLVSALSGYGLAAGALAPIDQMIRMAQEISAEDLSARLNIHSSDDEVGRLANTFDGMLARLEKSFKRERQFTSDASHELRTPVTAIVTIVSVTRAKRRSVEAYEKALDDIAYEADRLRSLADTLLQLARMDSQPAQPMEIVDLSTLIEDVCISLQPAAEEKGLELDYDISPGQTLFGDEDALIRVFINLLENAIKYTDTGKIQLSAHASDEQKLLIKISDTGQGIQAEHLPHIFERFYMVDPARSTQGAGLGLAIVNEIVRAHHGTICMESEPGLGSVFTIEFPRQENKDHKNNGQNA